MSDTPKIQVLGSLKGERGKSAYELALEHGFEGTEEEWLASLKGDSTSGGADGKDGSTPYIQDGYWYIDGVNTNVKAVGVDGTNGTDGTNGKDGVDGKDYVLTDDDKLEIAELVDGGGGLTTEQQDLLTKLSKWYDDEHYVAISITSFTSTLSGSYEKGSSVTGAVKLSWAFNRTPTALTLNGNTRDVTSTGETVVSTTYSSNATWTLKATGENGETSSKTQGIYFYNAVYYGVSASTTYDSTLIKSLTKNLRNSHLSSFTVTAGEGAYIYYCVPASFAAVTFNIGGFDGGITKVATVSYTNGTNTENYYIYRSDQANLGETTVKIK